MEENEASTDGIISIMWEQNTYVPGYGNDHLVWGFCVGDLLKVERSQNAQDDLQDSSTPTTRLEGLILTLADFHSYGNFLEVNCFLLQMYSVFLHQ